jgi:hypothetical protein
MSAHKHTTVRRLGFDCFFVEMRISICAIEDTLTQMDTQINTRKSYTLTKKDTEKSELFSYVALGGANL